MSPLKFVLELSDNDSTENHQVFRIGCKSEIIIHHDIKVLNKTPPVPNQNGTTVRSYVFSC